MSRKVTQYNISAYFAQPLRPDFEILHTDNQYLPSDGHAMRFSEGVIGICTSGSLEFSFHDKDYLITKNQIFCYLPGYYVCFNNSTPDYTATIARLSESFFKDITIRFPNVMFDYLLQNPIITLSPSALEEAKAYFKLIHAKSNEHGNLFQKDIIFNILYSFALDLYNLINRELQAQTPNQQLPLGRTHAERVFDKFTQLVQYNLKKNLPTTFYSDQLNITQKHLNRLVKEQKNMSLKQYIDQLRIYEIKQTLIRSEMSIQEISDLYHFSASDAFHHYFRKHVGCSPSYFRQQGQK